MKIAITQWQGRVSPVFDVADSMLILEVDHGRVRQREVASITGEAPIERARSLRRLGIQILICGALSRPMEIALISSGIEMIPCTCGGIDAVLEAFLYGRLNDKAFLMPGCDLRRHDTYIKDAHGRRK